MEEKLKVKEKISLKELFNSVVPEVNIAEVQLYLTIAIGLITILIIYLKFFRSSSKKNVVAIIGLCESGKTHLFSQLCYQADVLSVTSVKESSGYYTLKNQKNILMYDLPGHDRIRYNAFDKVKQQVRSLLIVIDASVIQKDIRDVAEFLYTIFCDGAVQSGKPQVLIICNKQDLPTAKGAPLIRASLEKEMNLLRVTKSNQLQSVGKGDNNNSFLGYPGQDFEFSHLKPLKISFAESIALKGSQIDEIKDWLDGVM